jgi:hypothetical protein
MRLLPQIIYAAALAIGVSSAAGAYADPIAGSLDAITASGAWGGAAPQTALSGPGLTWSFSFELPANFGSNPSALATNFAYTLNGAAVPTSLGSVLFFDDSDGGGFDLNFSDGDTIDIFSPDVGSAGTLLAGTYTDIGIGFSENDYGSGTLTIASAASVIEPFSASLLGAGLLSISLVRRSGRRR